MTENCSKYRMILCEAMDYVLQDDTRVFFLLQQMEPIYKEVGKQKGDQDPAHAKIQIPSNITWVALTFPFAFLHMHAYNTKPNNKTYEYNIYIYLQFLFLF